MYINTYRDITISITIMWGVLSTGSGLPTN